MSKELGLESESLWSKWRSEWEGKLREVAAAEMVGADAGHDLGHVERVVNAAERIGRVEGAAAEIVLPAAWLHDCVVVAKDSPLRNRASRMAADRAAVLLESIGYASEFIAPVRHAIEAHSFSAGIIPNSIEAKVVQDADRLEALGALGLARCLMTGGAMGRRLLHESEPFPVNRKADDLASSLDHLFVKLLKLPKMMQTEAGRVVANERAEFLLAFLRTLANELLIEQSVLDRALAKVT